MLGNDPTGSLSERSVPYRRVLHLDRAAGNVRFSAAIAGPNGNVLSAERVRR